MERSLRFVLLGTFTLRFSTGLTGAMLGLYLAKLPTFGGPAVDDWVVGVFAAVFFLSELVLSPIFGILSDRIGHHRVMLYGPVFGAVAVILTGLAVELPVLGLTRLLEGASTAASVPSILGFIALATAGNEILRGKAAARFEGATLAGLGVGFIVAPTLFQVFGQTAFFLNACVYGISFLIYWRGVKDPAGEAEAVASPHVGIDRYVRLVRSSHVLLLAPTWIALNASIGLWFSQSLFQFSKANPRFPDQFLMQGFDTVEITIAAIAIAVVFGAGLLYWGNRFKSMRRTTIILLGVLGGGVLVLAGFVVNHATGLIFVVPLSRDRGGGRRPVRDGRRDTGSARPAGRHLGALPGGPRRDHGPVLGLPRHRADHRQPDRRVRGFLARHRRDADRHLRPARHRPHPARPPAPPGARDRRQRRGHRRGRPGVSTGRPWVPVPVVRGSHGAVVAPHHLATAAGLSILRAGGSAVDAAIATNAALGVVVPNSCGIGGDAFWLIWDAAERRQLALNGSGRSAAGADAEGLRRAGHRTIPIHGPLSITTPGAVRSWADAHDRFGTLPRGRPPGPGHRTGARRGPDDRAGDRGRRPDRAADRRRARPGRAAPATAATGRPGVAAR